MVFLFLAVFNIILVIVWFVRLKNRRREALLSRFENEGDEDSDNVSDPEELENVAEEKPGNAFSKT